MQPSLFGRPRTKRSAIAAIALPAVALVLAACGSTSSGVVAAPTPPTSTATAPTAATTTDAAAPVSVSDAWVKSAQSGMTAMFGTIKNAGSTDVTVVAATSDAAGMLELHEVAMVDGAMKMQPKQGGFVVPAGGTHELKPGGDHVMLMNLKKPVEAGDPLTVVLALSDGTKVTVRSVGKDFTGANESYRPTPGASTSTSGM